MSQYSKAIGAAIGGAVAGTVGLPVLPDTAPWYAPIILYALSIGLPALAAYLAPKNSI